MLSSPPAMPSGATCFSAPQLDWAQRSRTSKRTSGSAGPWMRCSTACQRAGHDCCSRVAPRCRRPSALSRGFPKTSTSPSFATGQAADVAELVALSGKRRRARLDAIRIACQAYIAGPLTEQFTRLAASIIPRASFRLEPDPEDKDGQTLLLWYPAVTATTGDYMRSAVKIECGAKSALDPHVAATVTPYVAQDLPDLDLSGPISPPSSLSAPSGTRSSSCTVCDSGTTAAANYGMAGSASRATTTTCTC